LAVLPAVCNVWPRRANDSPAYTSVRLRDRRVPRAKTASLSVPVRRNCR
jgi:hypothetical protein